ncbi:MAG: hypothetical protein QM765_19705 [Myxococcales bacterium]
MVQAFFAPTGGAVGPNPTLYLFSPIKQGELRLEARTPGGTVLATEAKEVSAYDAYRVFRIVVKSSADFTISAALELSKGGVEASARSMGLDKAPAIPLKQTLSRADYRVAPQRPRLRDAFAKIKGVEVEQRTWTCSFQQSRNLATSVEAPAFRLEWARSAQDYRQGRREKVVLPASRQGELWVIKLGHLDCVGWTFPWEGGDVFVGVAGLHEDGSETPPDPEPFRVVRHEPRRPARE